MWIGPDKHLWGLRASLEPLDSLDWVRYPNVVLQLSQSEFGTLPLMSIFYVTIAAYILIGGVGVGALRVAAFVRFHFGVSGRDCWRYFPMGQRAWKLLLRQALPRLLHAFSETAQEGASHLLCGFLEQCGAILSPEALEKVFGKRAPAVLDAAWVYVCYTSNPLVQIFYAVISA